MRIVPLIFLGYLFAYLDRINLGLAKLKMLDALGFNELVYGLGGGLFFVAYIVFEVPSNIILQKVGARWWLARIMITWGILSGLTAFVTDVWQFYLLRFLLGVAEAGFVPGVLLYLTQWYPSRRRARIIGFFLIGLPAASLLGGPLSGWIMSWFDGANSWMGWQWLFLLEAAPAILLGLLLPLALSSSIRTAGWLSAAEKEQLETVLEADRDELPAQGHDIGAAFRSGRVWRLGLVAFSFLTATYTISFWLPTILQEAGASGPNVIGWLTAIPSACGIVALLMNGFLSDRARERRWHIIVPFALAIAGLAAAIATDGSVLFVTLAITLANIGIVASYPVFWCLPGVFLQGAAAAAGMALISSIGNLGGFVATYALAWTKDLTGTAASGFIAAIVLLAISIVIIHRLPAGEVNR
ncbi:MFS transporter [Nonomuraea sp. NBC_01738]|uniref:MFS transporter n=1 Tax=Nonomuraea sp. NBC_01738 TaxID=2976003 RepID=UPI002E0DE0C5|nr:MFS transporter [Nonomuraea sp. NBC_01738]